MPGVNYGRAVMKMRPDWQPGQTARPLDVVYYQNCLWACLRETNALPSLASADWMLSVRSVESDLTGGTEGQVLTIVKVGQDLKAQYKALPTYGVSDITGAVATSRKLNTTSPLSGGGDLSADRTFKINIGKGLKVDNNLLVLSVKEGSGLIMDNKTGELYFDPSQMPTDQFEALLKSIRVPLWLSKNTAWYVDGTNGSDQNDGSSPAKAFKTIQAAVNYISENFNLGRYAATVSVAGGTYSELISLPKYNASTGTFQIIGSSDTANPTVLVGCVYCSAGGLGTYTLNNLAIEFNEAVTPGSVHYRSISGSPGTTINIYNCAMNLGTTPLSFTRVCVAPSGGVFNILDGCSMTGLASHFFYLTGGSLALHRDMSINGDCGVDVFRARDLSVFSTNAPSNGGVNPVISGVVNSGRRYYVAGNSICSTGGGGAEYFPGATAGQVYTGGQYS